MHNNTNYHGWNKALTFGVGSIQLSFRTIVFTQAKMFSIQMLLHFSQIVQRVCTSVLFSYFVVDLISYLVTISDTINIARHDYMYMYIAIL